MKSSKCCFTLSTIVRQDWVKAIIIAFLILFVFIFSLELTDRIAFRPKSIFARTVRDFEKQKGEVQVLFLGQSDVKYSIIPDEFGYRAYNFSSEGESFIETYYKLNHYIKDMPKLKIIVLPIGLPSFSSFRADEIQWEYFEYGYIAYSDIPEFYRRKGMMVIREKLLSYCPILKRMQMIYFLRNIGRLLTNRPIDKTEMYNGYIKNAESNVSEEGALKRLKRHFNGQNVLDGDFLLYFEKILKLCKDNNIKVFVVTLPVSKYYLENSKKYINKDLLYNRVLNNPAYSKYIYNYLDLLEIYVNYDELFLNQDHLNHKGAQKVTRLIVSEWSEPMRKIVDVK